MKYNIYLILFLLNSIHFCSGMERDALSLKLPETNKIRSLLEMAAMAAAKEIMGELDGNDLTSCIELYIKEAMLGRKFGSSFEQKMKKLNAYNELLQKVLGEHAYIIGVINKCLQKSYELKLCSNCMSDPYSFANEEHLVEEVRPLAFAYKKNSKAAYIITKMLFDNNQIKSQKIANSWIKQILSKICFFNFINNFLNMLKNKIYD